MSLNDPTVTGFAVATLMWRAIELNSSMRSLATPTPGHVAVRSRPDEPWRFLVPGDGEDEF